MCDGYLGMKKGVGGYFCDRCSVRLTQSQIIDYLHQSIIDLQATQFKLIEGFMTYQGMDACSVCGRWFKDKELFHTVDSAYCMACWGSGIIEDAPDFDWQEGEEQEHIAKIVRFITRHPKWITDSIRMQYMDRTDNGWIWKEPFLSTARRILP